MKEGVIVMEKEIKPRTTFELKANLALTVNEIQTLTLLYQPLIGPEAMSLFFTLNSMGGQINQPTQTHHLLLQILNISIDKLIHYRNKLEAVGLVQVYFTDEDNYVYLLKPPVKPQSFFNDAIFNGFLYLKVGNADYQTLKKYFIILEEEVKGTLVTKKFNEVFDTTALMNSNQILQATPLPESKEAKPGIHLEYVFNRETLRVLLKQNGLEEKRISDKLFEELNKIAFLYKLDEHELARQVFDATDAEGFVNLEDMRKYAKRYFNFVNKGKLTEVIEIPQASNLPTSKDENRRNSKEENLLELLSGNPFDFLKLKSNQKNPVPADQKLVEWLYIDQQMPAGVVNVMIDYVLKISDGRLPKALIEKIAGEWQRKNIDSTEKAMKQVEKVFEAQKKRETEKKIPAAQSTYLKTGRIIRQEPVPEWLNKPREIVGKDSLSDQDLKKIEQMKQLQNQILNRKG